METLNSETMIRALRALDRQIYDLSWKKPVELIVGGGGAMVLAHGFPLATADIDAIPRGMSIAELDPLVKKVAETLNLPTDWLNPYYSTYSHTLPPDYSSRLIEVYKGKSLSVSALGKEEMLIMKCFAHRQKDVGHARNLIRKGTNLNFVEKHIESLRKKRIPGASEALDFLDDILEQEE